MAKDMWKIMRLRSGHGERDAANFLGPAHAKEPYLVTYWSFAVWNDEHKVIVDTAVNEEDEHLWYTDVPNIIKPEERLPRQIKDNLGWDVEDVDTVILTHLHWDHTGYNYVFKNADFYVQREEYEYGIRYGQTPGFPFFHKKANFDKTAVPYHRWRFVDGEAQIFPGLMVIPTPGHSKAMQSVLVNTDEGAACITGDAVNTLYSIENDFVTGVMMDAEAQRATYRKIRQVADVILTSHDVNSDSCYDHQTGGWPKLD